MNRQALGWAAVIGLVLLVGAFVLAVMPVRQDGVDCGNAFSKSRDATMSALVYGADSCDDALSSRRTVAFAIGIPAMLVTMIAGIGWAATESQPRQA